MLDEITAVMELEVRARTESVAGEVSEAYGAARVPSGGTVSLPVMPPRDQ